MTDAVTAKLAEWEALTEAATEGPWEAHEGAVGAMTGPRDCGGCSGLVSPRHEPACFWSEVAGAAPADAEFIAAARTAMPALLAFVREMRAMHVSSSESRGVGRVDPETGEWGAHCDHDSEWWPCPTVQALTKWIGGEG